MKYCQKCGKELVDEAVVCVNCGCSVSNNSITNVQSSEKENNLIRFLLTFFLGWIGSIIINHSSLKPAGFKSRTLAYIFLTMITFGIYGLVASICNLTFDPAKPNNIGYFKG